METSDLTDRQIVNKWGDKLTAKFGQTHRYLMSDWTWTEWESRLYFLCSVDRFERVFNSSVATGTKTNPWLVWKSVSSRKLAKASRARILASLPAKLASVCVIKSKASSTQETNMIHNEVSVNHRSTEFWGNWNRRHCGPTEKSISSADVFLRRSRSPASAGALCPTTSRHRHWQRPSS